MDWQTITLSILGSGVIAALVSGFMNHRTQIIAIKESGLYAKRAEVLDELMKRMEDMDRLMGELVSPIQLDASDDAEKERRIQVIDASKHFNSFFRSHRHYLPKYLSDDIDILCVEYREVFLKFAWDARPLNDKPNIFKWGKLIDDHKNEYREKRELVASEFRKMVGVESPMRPLNYIVGIFKK